MGSRCGRCGDDLLRGERGTCSPCALGERAAHPPLRGQEPPTREGEDGVISAVATPALTTDASGSSVEQDQ